MILLKISKLKWRIKRGFSILKTLARMQRAITATGFLLWNSDGIFCSKQRFVRNWKFPAICFFFQFLRWYLDFRWELRLAIAIKPGKRYKRKWSKMWSKMIQNDPKCARRFKARKVRRITIKYFNSMLFMI